MMESRPPVSMLRRIWQHGLGRWVLAIMGFWLVMALGGYVLATDASPNANRMNLAYAAQPIGVRLPLEEAPRLQAKPLHWWFVGDAGAPAWMPSETQEIRMWLGTYRYGRDLWSRLILG